MSVSKNWGLENGGIRRICAADESHGPSRLPPQRHA
jgi:hypothetical protein